MRLKVFNTALCVLFFSSFLAGTLQATASNGTAPNQEFSKTINREFATSAEGMTALYNKHGKVNVNSWDKKSVKIDITITVNANNQDDANKAFDRIKVNFTNTQGYVKAETVLDDGNMNVCQDFKINYDVWMPVGNQLDLKNKYGNSYVGKLDGKLTAEIKYGDLRTEAINNDADLSIGYGKASIEKLRNLYGQVSYGGLVLMEGGDIQLDSKYSETRIDKANVIRLTSKYDNLTIGQVTEFRLQTKYSDVRVDKANSAYFTAQYTDLQIGTISDFMDADLTYGDLKIGQLSRGAGDIRIIGKYTDVEIRTEANAAFRFDAQGSYTDLHYPQSARINNKTDEGTMKTVSGYVGGDANAKAKVTAKLSYGNFVIK